MTTIDLDQLAKVIGKAITRHRLTKGLTQEQLAEQLGIGNEAVSRMERGIVMPTVARLVEIAVILECDVAALLSEVSSHEDGQAQHLARLLSPLSIKDRTMVISVVEQLSARLQQ